MKFRASFYDAYNLVIPFVLFWQHRNRKRVIKRRYRPAVGKQRILFPLYRCSRRPSERLLCAAKMKARFLTAWSWFRHSWAVIGVARRSCVKIVRALRHASSCHTRLHGQSSAHALTRPPPRSMPRKLAGNCASFANAVQYPIYACLLYTSPSPRDRQKSRMPSSA